MKIEEAIKILKLYAKGVPKTNRTPFEDALELGIEALKAVKKIRVNGYWSADGSLSGETK